MSYILDALKKSEQERGRGTAPSVQTMHSSSLNYHSSKTQLWPYLLLLAILINLAALIYFIITKNDTAVSTENRQTAIETPALAMHAADTVNSEPVASASSNNSEETIIYKPVSMPGTGNTTAAQTPKAEATTPRYQPARGMIMEREELPADVQQYIPVMEFSAHVYSSNPLQRSIVINGRFMEEGDRLTSDLLLDEITPDGAVFDFQGQLFRQSVVSAWN
jgi:general secretion pathway protein B